jgi:hypothetical protein
LRLRINPKSHPSPKEVPMHYKTIILELLQQRPLIYDQFLKQRTLLPALEAHAQELKTIHEAWRDRLWQTRPDSDPSQVASEALELALKEMEDRLPSAPPPDDSEAMSLDAAMTLIRHTRRA